MTLAFGATQCFQIKAWHEHSHLCFIMNEPKHWIVVIINLLTKAIGIFDCLGVSAYVCKHMLLDATILSVIHACQAVSAVKGSSYGWVRDMMYWLVTQLRKNMPEGQQYTARELTARYPTCIVFLLSPQQPGTVHDEHGPM